SGPSRRSSRSPSAASVAVIVFASRRSLTGRHHGSSGLEPSLIGRGHIRCAKERRHTMSFHSSFVRALLVLASTGALAFGGAQVPGAASRATSSAAPAGDNGSAPDITAVQVSDDSSGQLTFQLQMPGTSDITGDQRVALLIDSDQSAATG